MFLRLRLLLAGVILGFGLLGWSAQASAQAVFETGPSGGTLGTGANQQFLAKITVSAPVTITGIAQRSRTFAQSNYRFVILDWSDASVLYSSTKNFAADSGAATYKQSDYFSYTLMPGTTYSIGGVSDQPSTIYFSGCFGCTTTQNNVSSVGNDDYSGSPVLTRSTFGWAVPDIRLSNGPAPVPTLSAWAMILFGLVLAGGAAVVLQRRRLAVG